MSDDELLDYVRSTFPVLDRWHNALAAPTGPAAGSELGHDDTDWKFAPASAMARAGLGSARDHLHAVRVHLEAHEYFPIAQSSLIRAALVGAAQAVWILAPDERVERLVRARAVAFDSYRNHLTFANEAITDLPPSNLLPTAEVAHSHIRQRRDELRAKRTAEGQLSERLDLTNMVRAAARATFTDPVLVAQTNLVWRSTSGAAHGLMWPLLGQPDTSLHGEPDEDGMAFHVAAGGVRRIANDYACAFRVAEKGWELISSRGGTSPP